MGVQMIPVSSSTIVAVGYDSAAQQLLVEFRNGTYVYYAVPKYVYDGLMSAYSHGEYHAAYIKNTYRYDRIR
jgi:hypothetical protein